MSNKFTLNKWDALRGLVPFVQFKKRKKHPWRKVTLIPNGTKSHKPSEIYFEQIFTKMCTYIQLQRILPTNKSDVFRDNEIIYFTMMPGCTFPIAIFFKDLVYVGPWLQSHENDINQIISFRIEGIWCKIYLDLHRCI